MTKHIKRIIQLIQNPYYKPFPEHQLSDWEHNKNVIYLQPYNRPLYHPRTYHPKPLAKAFRLFNLRKQNKIPEKQLDQVYKYYKKQMYG